jgi:hypothetical protein
MTAELREELEEKEAEIQKLKLAHKKEMKKLIRSYNERRRIS